MDDAKRYVTFTDEDDEKNAFECALTLEDLAKLTFSVETKEGIEQRKANKQNETDKDKDFFNFQNGRKVLKNKQQLGNIAYNSTIFRLKRWRAYEIKVIVKWRKQEARSTFRHDTFQWMCQDEKQTTISQTEFCNGVEDCPDGADENHDICVASDLFKMSYILSYPIMLIFIIFYFMLPKIKYRQSLVKKIKQEFGMVNSKSKRNQDISTRKQEFTLKYIQAHSNTSEMKMLVEEVKYNLFKKGNKENLGEISSWVKEIEDQIHKNPEECYQCILTHYKGCHPLINRIADPEGGIIGRLGKIGFTPNCLFLFIALLFNIFDYVKDIGNTHTFNVK